MWEAYRANHPSTYDGKKWDAPEFIDRITQPSPDTPASPRPRRLQKLGDDATLYVTMTATLTSRGQLTIPVAVRKRLGLRTGARVSFELTSEAKSSVQYSDTPKKKLPITTIKGFFSKPAKAATIEDMREAIGCGGEEGKW